MSLLKPMATRHLQKQSIAIVMLMVLGLGTPNKLYAQCSWSGVGTTYWFNNTTALNCGTAAHTEMVGSGTYSYVYLTTGNTYCFSTCGSTFDTQISIYDGNPSWTLRDYNNDNGPDCPGNNASLSYKAVFTGTHLVVVNRYNCTQHDFTGESAVLSIRECGQDNPVITGGGSHCQTSYTFTRGTPPNTSIIYYWQTSPTGTATTNSAASYTVTGTGVFTVYLRARSQGGCWIGIDSATVTLNRLRIDSLTAPLYPNGYNIDAYGNATGSIDLTATATAQPLTYAWSNGNTTEDISGLLAGTYYVTVTDTAGCMAMDSITLTGPPPCSVPFVMPSGTIVGGGSFCQLSYEFSHGNPFVGVNYYWQSSATDTSIANSASTLSVSGGGTYTVYLNAQNSLGCWSTADSATVTLDTMVIDSITSPRYPNGFNIDSSGNATGSIDLTVSGFGAPYTYTWSNGDTVEDPTALVAGKYIVTVTSSNGCADTIDITLTEPLPVGIGINSVAHNATECSVYPNPFSDVLNFNIQVPSTTTAKLQVYNLNGEMVSLVFEGKLVGNKLHQLQMDQTDLASGIYYYQFSTASGIHLSGKLVKVGR